MSKQPKTAKKQKRQISQESLRSASSDETIAPLQRIGTKEFVEKEVPEIKFMSISATYDQIQKQKARTSKFYWKRPEKVAQTFTCFCKKIYTYKRGLKQHVNSEHKGDPQAADLLDLLSKRPYKARADVYGEQKDKMRAKIVLNLFPKTISEKVRNFLCLQKGWDSPQTKLSIKNEEWKLLMNKLVDGLLTSYKRVDIFLKHLNLEQLLILFLQCIVVANQQISLPSSSWTPIEAIFRAFVNWLNQHYRRILDDFASNSYHILLGPEQKYCSSLGTWMIQNIIKKYLARKQLPFQKYTSFFLTSFLTFLNQKGLLST